MRNRSGTVLCMKMCYVGQAQISATTTNQKIDFFETNIMKTFGFWSSRDNEFIVIAKVHLIFSHNFSNCPCNKEKMIDAIVLMHTEQCQLCYN